MVTPVSSTATQAAVPSGTVPLACNCDQLQRAQQRLQALASQCKERIDRLQQAFDRLPAAASFDPFAVAAPAPSGGAATAAAPAPRPPADALRHAPTLGRVSTSGLQPLPPGQAQQAPAAGGGPGIAGALAGAAAGRPGASLGTVVSSAAPGAGNDQQRADASVASLNGWLGSLGTLAALGGEQVALLMQRHAAPSLAVGLGGAVADAVATALGADGPGAQPARVQRRRDAGGLLGASLGSAVQVALSSHESGAAQRPSTVLGQGLAQGLSAAFTAVGWPDMQTMPARLGGAASQALATAPQLLEHLLAQGLGSAVAGTLGGSAQPAKPARQPAPRAASRLVGAQSSAAGHEARAQVPDAPAAASLDALDAGEAMAQQISRLLLDQAWMRGVDLR